VRLLPEVRRAGGAQLPEEPTRPKQEWREDASFKIRVAKSSSKSEQMIKIAHSEIEMYYIRHLYYLVLYTTPNLLAKFHLLKL